VPNNFSLNLTTDIKQKQHLSHLLVQICLLAVHKVPPPSRATAFAA